MKNVKKILNKALLFICLNLISTALLLSQIAIPPAAGDGTEENPYEIATLENLFWISADTSKWDKHYIQTENINASETASWYEGEGWVPIGESYGNSFSGSYNGDGYIIDSLTINRPQAYYQGLFGTVDEALIVNLGVTNVDIIGNAYCGGLVGLNVASIIKNCYSTGYVAGYAEIGGLVGVNSYSAISNSFSLCSVIGTEFNIGGFAGSNYYATIINCYSLGNVDGGGVVGGLIGINWYDASVKNSYSIGFVNGNFGYVGGLLGRNEATVENCFWDITTSGQSESAGGTGKSTEEMNDFLTYAENGWDFKGIGIEGVWNIGNERNDGYPYFDWQYPNDEAPDITVTPIVITGQATVIASDKVHLSIAIINSGNPKASQYGVAWNSFGNPVIEENKTEEGVVTGAGFFNTEISGLITNQTYFARAYVIYEELVIYGEEVSFLTYETPVGAGTPEHPYQIGKLSELYWIADDASRWNKHFIQTTHINASPTSTWNNGEGWIPIGESYGNNFSGSYNGNGYVIDSLTINRPQTNNQGLFGYVSGGNVSNLGISNANITGKYYVGILAGRIDNSHINKCFSNGIISSDFENIGGLIGLSHNSTVNNSYSSGNLTGNRNIGGLIGGINRSGVNDSYSYSSVNGNSYVGGFIGFNNNSSVISSFWDVETSGQSQSAGGTGMSTEEMKDFLTFAENGWDFKGIGIEGIWNIGNERNDGYPYFDWQYPKDEAPNIPVAPIVRTGSPTVIANDKVNVSIQIINTGNPKASQYGVAWNSSGNPVIEENKTEEGVVTGAGFFNTEISGLVTNQTYYARAYVIYEDLVIYGEEVSFLTYETPDGAGTLENPYQIATLSDLYWIADDTSRWDKHFIQTADINSSATSTWNNGEGWVPIGNDDNRFTGVYNGNNHAIDSLFINRPYSYNIGLFGYIFKAKIINLGLTNVEITGHTRVGAIVGIALDTCLISYSYSTGNVSGNSEVGGLVGSSYYSVINYSKSMCNITGINFSNRTGGLVGANYNSSYIHDCYADGNVNGYYNYGGLVGINNGGRISRSYAHGNIEGYQGGGGLIGYTYNTEVSDSYSFATVNGHQRIGGLIGWAHSTTNVKNCYSISKVIGENNIGGLVGENSDTTVFNSFWDIGLSGADVSDGGTGKDSIEMRNIDTYTDTSTVGLDEAWDFLGSVNDDTGNKDYWGIDSMLNNGYPYLTWQYHAYDVTYEAGENGSILGQSSQLVNHGWQSRPVRAVPDQGFSFVDWSDGRNDNPRVDTFVIAEISVIANFELINQDITTSISADLKSETHIYPNPFSNTLTFDNTGNLKGIEIANLMGQVIMQIPVNGKPEVVIQTEGMKNGVYLVVLYGKDGGREVRKVVKE